jgi:NhaP-type Na+/H+ or K+/H+ antiporter
MGFTGWYIIVGVVLVAMALAGTVVKRLPLTPSMFYLALGVALGPYGFDLIRLDPIGQSKLLEHLTEAAVIVSLFTAGLKLRVPPWDERWRAPIRLAFGSMALTVGLIALVGTALLGLPVGAAVLLGAILAPTDPVLASDVQVGDGTDPDPDRLRFSLTGEAGFNDGTAFPFVMLGLGLLGLHDLGAGGWRWWVVDVAWAVVGGIAIGWLLGAAIGRLVLYLRRTHEEAVGLDDFLALGLLALAYGIALACSAYGFLAAFTAGLALRYVEARASGDPNSAPPDVKSSASAEDQHHVATDPERAPAYMAQAVLGFNEQIERIAEVAVIILLGGMLLRPGLVRDAFWFVPLLLFVIRPLAVWAGLAGLGGTTGLRRGLIAWFGIRGVGSIYYLMYAISHGVASPVADRLVALTFATVAASITLHGISVTPLMNLYERRRSNRRATPGPRGPRGTVPDEGEASVTT